MRERQTMTRGAALSVFVLGALGLSLWPGRGGAYEADSTLAGLTQQAGLGSRLHRVLLTRFGRSQGVFDPLRLRLARLPSEEARALRTRLLRLDPAEGYAPEDMSLLVPGAGGPRALRAPERQTALGWLAAGAVLESLQPARTRNHFLDARSGAGLTLVGDEGRGGTAMASLARGLSSTRELMTGVAFDGTGLPATTWLQRPDNDLSLVAYHRAYTTAVTAAAQEDREIGLAKALLAAGAVLSVLGQMGDPAYVRNDPDPLLGAGAYQAFVAQRYGRAGVPVPLADKDAPQIKDVRRLWTLFTSGAADGPGLAERTARRFFSAGSLPGTARGAEELRPPGLPSLVFRHGGPATTGGMGGALLPPGDTRVPLGWSRESAGYVGDAEVPHRVAWRRIAGEPGVPPRLRWFLDERCYADYAALLLPEVERYQIAALDLLLSGDLVLAKGAAVNDVVVRYAGAGAVQSGTLLVLGEGADGQRRLLHKAPVSAGAADAPLWQGALPAGLSRATVLLDGVDERGEPVLTSAEMTL